MYAALWRILPGPTWIRILLLVALGLVVLVAADLWLFPFIASLVDSGNTGAVSTG
ncbi:MAG: hypothetical protein QOD05_1779 [Microbacteriaceae bacterium]|jgi:hypothetical protein|nr:hypothetical protein [Microbacteriaceae bacterium]